MDFHHIGIATDDASALAETYGAVFDAHITHQEEFNGLQVAFCDIGSGYLELLEPLTDRGPVARFLDNDGPGLHHVALECEDIEAALTRAENHGIDIIDREPRPGAWGHEVAFLHPDSTGGVLVEYVDH